MALFLGIDVGGTSTKIGLVDENGTIARSGSFTTSQSPEELIQKIAQWANGERIAAAGAGVPAPLDAKREMIIFAPNLKWRDVPFRKMLQDALGVPAVIENDANLAAYGEYRCGAASGYKSCALFTLGTGVGGGIVISGQLLLGDTGFAAELGHITVNADGPKCGCGNQGCLEAYASATAMKRHYKELTGKEAAEAKEIFEKAQKGDETCAAIVDEAAKALGIAAAGIAHTINPSAVVISGGIGGAGDFFLEKIRSEAKKRMFKECALDVVPGKLGTTAGIIGAAMWAKEKFVNEIV